MMPISSSILDKVRTIQNVKMTNVILRRKPKDLYGFFLRQPADQNDNAVVNFTFFRRRRRACRQAGIRLWRRFFEFCIILARLSYKYL